ncbi:MAG TPA: hypothetical protein VKV22_10905 [Rhodanobacteraceae bacterium]|nr:hypothetical protein [Rhodanobacteraceae bacterium]
MPEDFFLLLPDFFDAEDFLAEDFFVEDFLAPLPDFFDEPFLPLPDFFPEEDLLPLPDFLPPLSCLLTVRQARSSASFFETPFFS